MLHLPLLHELLHRAGNVLNGHVGVRWEFTEDGHDFSVAVPARVVTNDLALMLRLTLAGVGLTLRDDEAIRPLVDYLLQDRQGQVPSMEHRALRR